MTRSLDDGATLRIRFAGVERNPFKTLFGAPNGTKDRKTYSQAKIPGRRVEFDQFPGQIFAENCCKKALKDYKK